MIQACLYQSSGAQTAREAAAAGQTVGTTNVARQLHDRKRRPQRSSAAHMPVRERILQTARDSFYREGIRAVGVDTLIARSGVAKMSFYRSFRSKDDLVCAYLECEAAEYWQWWDAVVGSHAQAPRKQLRALFA